MSFPLIPPSHSVDKLLSQQSQPIDRQPTQPATANNPFGTQKEPATQPKVVEKNDSSDALRRQNAFLNLVPEEN